MWRSMGCLLTHMQKSNESYQGFAKYNANYEANESYVAGLPNSGITRSQSLSNSAGQAALAALRKHAQPVQQQQQTQGHNQRRTNSLMTGGSRSNSMRSFTYNPPASYSVGPVAAQRRHNSLNTRSELHRPNNTPNRMGSLNSASLRTPISEENDIADEEEEIMVTTKTTKVVDSFGRTKSITTETIKTLPDGSNIIETTTKNISRSNSRTGSLKNNSLSNANYNSINLSKIDEDLHDFDYNYQMDNSHLNENTNKLEPNLNLSTDDHLGSPLLQASPVPNLAHDSRSNSLDYQLSNNSQNQNSIHEVKKSRPQNEQIKGSLVSKNSSPTRPLKSILKYKDTNTSDDMEFKDAVQSLPDDQNIHPYKKLSKHNYEEPKSPIVVSPRESKASSPRESKVLSSRDCKVSSPRSSNIHSEKVISSPKVKPTANHDHYKQEYGSPPSSIKFSEEVERIPNYREEEGPSEADIYALAMKAAMKKVYGDRDPNSTQVEQSNNDIGRASSFTKETVHNLKAQSSHGSGYKYESHNKEFSLHSMRNNDSVSSSTRKQRAKEERKNAKKLEKEKVKAEKKAEKIAERVEKDAKKKKSRSFFDRMSKVPTEAHDDVDTHVDQNSEKYGDTNIENYYSASSEHESGQASNSHYEELSNEKVSEKSVIVDVPVIAEPANDFIVNEGYPSPSVPLDVKSIKSQDEEAIRKPEKAQPVILKTPQATVSKVSEKPKEVQLSDKSGVSEEPQPDKLTTNDVPFNSEDNQDIIIVDPVVEVDMAEQEEKLVVPPLSDVSHESNSNNQTKEVNKLSNVIPSDSSGRVSLENKVTAPGVNSINPSSSRSLDEPIEAPVDVPIYSFDNINPGKEEGGNARPQNNGARRNSLPFGKGNKKKQQDNGMTKKKGSFREKFFKYFISGYNN